MNGNEILIDTNIVLYLIDGHSRVQEFLNGKNIWISFVTEIELFSYFSEEQDDLINSILQEINVVEMNKIIKNHTIDLRRKRKLKLPDALILGCASFKNIPLFTADKKLWKSNPDNIILYDLDF